MESEKEMRVYEIGFLLVPTIAEENLAASVQTIKDLVASHGGVMIAEEYPKMIDLAYEMVKVISNKNHKFTTAYFGWVKFEMEPAQALAIEETLDRSIDIIRYLLIKTVRENTIVGKRLSMKGSDTKKRVSSKSKEDAGEEAPASPEEIDKQIDALVDEETPVV